MARQVIVKASEGHRSFGKLLKRVYNSNEHLVVERDGFPVAVILSYQEYEQLSQSTVSPAIIENLPPPLSLEEAFGSITPINKPEDFKQLRDVAIEEHLKKTTSNK
ncbi:MAG TPA: type II toxin-antitoxin system prevent-host-death family antitoxin [Anaerolineae bacterium]|nr:type II toxin-antitoxin system prevent-host-death family antitoxin [Anaerolineae bacterium]HMR62763.1 type II toxin-antitoxin system prevent-host-death family antitoxin [Anaerolineae bacterium]